MRRELFNDHSEDNAYHIADVHVIKSESDQVNMPQNYHYHNCFEIIIVEQGEIKVMVNYTIKSLPSGHIVMLRNNMPHKIISYSESCRITIIHIPQKVLLWNMEDIPELHDECMFVKNSRSGYHFDSQALFRKVMLHSRKIAEETGFMRLSHLYQMLHLLSTDERHERLVETWDENSEPTDIMGENSIDRTYHYLYEHFAENHSLDQIASFANQNKTALCRAFKKAAGYTIFQFMNRLRVERACELIKNTDESITNIAYLVGYSSFSYFSRQFHIVTGMSPSTFRKEV